LTGFGGLLRCAERVRLGVDAKANDRSQQGLPEEAMQKANVVEDSWRADKIIVFYVQDSGTRKDDGNGDEAIFMDSARRHGM
jgi:hypothetical protein